MNVPDWMRVKESLMPRVVHQWWDIYDLCPLWPGPKPNSSGAVWGSPSNPMQMHYFYASEYSWGTREPINCPWCLENPKEIG